MDATRYGKRKGLFPGLTLTLSLAALMVGAAGHAAQGALVLKIDDPDTVGVDVIVADNQAAGTLTDSGLPTTDTDPDSAMGIIDFDQGFVDVTGASKPAFGPRALELFVRANGVGNATVMLTDTDFTASGGGVLRSLAGGFTGGSISFTGTFDPDNKEFGMGGSPQSVSGSTLGNTFSFNVNSPNPPFSLTGGVTIDQASTQDSTVIDHVVEFVPEPSTAALSLLGVGAVALRRRRCR